MGGLSSRPSSAGFLCTGLVLLGCGGAETTAPPPADGKVGWRCLAEGVVAGVLAAPSPMHTWTGAVAVLPDFDPTTSPIAGWRVDGKEQAPPSPGHPIAVLDT